MKCSVNQFIFHNGLQKPISLSIRGQGIYNLCTNCPLLLTYVTRIYGLLVWTILPTENIKFTCHIDRCYLRNNCITAIEGKLWCFISWRLTTAYCNVPLTVAKAVIIPSQSLSRRDRVHNISPSFVFTCLRLDLPSVLFHPGLKIRDLYAFFIHFVSILSEQI